MKNRGADLAGGLDQRRFVRIGESISRQMLLRMKRLQSRPPDDTARDPDRIRRYPAILVG